MIEMLGTFSLLIIRTTFKLEFEGEKFIRFYNLLFIDLKSTEILI